MKDYNKLTMFFKCCIIRYERFEVCLVLNYVFDNILTVTEMVSYMTLVLVSQGSEQTISVTKERNTAL